MAQTTPPPSLYRSDATLITYYIQTLVGKDVHMVMGSDHCEVCKQKKTRPLPDTKEAAPTKSLTGNLQFVLVFAADKQMKLNVPRS